VVDEPLRLNDATALTPDAHTEHVHVTFEVTVDIHDGLPLWAGSGVLDGVSDDETAPVFGVCFSFAVLGLEESGASSLHVVNALAFVDFVDATGVAVSDLYH